MKFSVFFLILILPISSIAYLSTLTTGSTLNQGEYKISPEAQFITNAEFDDNEGFNLIGHFDMGLTDEANLRATLGFGTVDFQAGIAYKWIPIPDYDEQPAMGLIASANYARFDGLSDLIVRVQPIISKKYDVNFGKITPFASLPIGFQSVDGESFTPIHLVVGSELMPSSLSKISFIAEIGFEINEAFTYFSIGANLHFDDLNSISFE